MNLQKRGFSVGGPPLPPKQMGSLFDVRQDMTSRDADTYNRSSTSSVPEGPNSMLAPSPQAIA